MARLEVGTTAATANPKVLLVVIHFPKQIEELIRKQF